MKCLSKRTSVSTVPVAACTHRRTLSSLYGTDVISCRACISNEEVHWRTDQPPHTSSVPPTLNSLVTMHVPVHLRATLEPSGPVLPLCEGTETTDRAVSHLAPDRWIRSSTSQHWPVNHLSSSAESPSLEHAGRNGNVQHWTSHTMMSALLLCKRPLYLQNKSITFCFIHVSSLFHLLLLVLVFVKPAQLSDLLN